MKRLLSNVLHALADRIFQDPLGLGKPAIDSDGRTLKRCSSCGVPRGTFQHGLLVRANTCSDPDAIAPTAVPQIHELPIVPVNESAVADAKRFLSPRNGSIAHEIAVAIRALVTYNESLEARLEAYRSALESARSHALPALMVTLGKDGGHDDAFKKGAMSVARPVTDAVDRVLALRDRASNA